MECASQRRLTDSIDRRIDSLDKNVKFIRGASVLEVGKITIQHHVSK